MTASLQHGWFTLHRFSNSSKKFVPLEKNSDAKKFLSEYVIPSKYRDDILQSLNRHGINKKTLFPGLEGLCDFINWNYLS